MVKDMESHPDLRNTEKFYEMTREEQLIFNARKVLRYYELFKDKYFTNYDRPFDPFATTLIQGQVR